MQRKIYIIIALCLIIMLCGCQSKHVAQETTTQDKTTIITPPETTDSTEANSPTEGVVTKNPTEETLSNPYLIRCPVFHSEDYNYSLSNKTIESILKQKIDYILDDSNDVTDFSADYTVKLQSSNYTSILYEIYLNVEETAHPVDIAFGINVDMAGQTVALQDILTVDGVLIENFRTAWKEQTNEALQDYLNQYTDDKLLEVFEGIDPISSDVSFYITEEYIVIIFPIPRAAGSNVFIKLPKESHSDTNNVNSNKQDGGQHYLVTEVNGLFSYTILNKDQEIVRSEENLTKQPEIAIVSDSIMSITTQAGTGIATSSTYYYNIANDCFSSIYQSVLTQNQNIVVYATSDKIIIHDIFDSNDHYQEISNFQEPFSPVAFPFVKAEFVDGNASVRITYLSGTEYKEVSESFELEE